MKMDDKIITTLSSGKVCMLDIFEISEIPDISILLNQSQTEKEYLRESKNGFKKMLSEFYTSCKKDIKINDDTTFSLELMFTSEKAINQIYNARVKIYMIIRMISLKKTILTTKISEIKTSLKNILEINKYGVNEDIDKNRITESLIELNKQEKRFILKDYNLESFQYNKNPICFSFDAIPTHDDNFENVIKILIEYPNSAIVFDLIPYELSEEEINNIERMSGNLDLMYNGSNFPGASPNPLVEKSANIYRYYKDNSRNILFNYNMYVCSNKTNINEITNRLQSEIANGNNTNIALTNSIITEQLINADTFFITLPWKINLEISKRYKEKIPKDLQSFCKLLYTITLEEAAQFFRIPFGNKDLAAGINIAKYDKSISEYPSFSVSDSDIVVGTLKKSKDKKSIGFSYNNLTKNMLISGTPGSGKTTFSLNLLYNTWKKAKIPFLVIEPVKTEYRELINLIDDIQIFTPGKEFISPFVFNPFIPPKYVSLGSYKSILKTAFSTAIPLPEESPLNLIFEETVEECYEEAGWYDFSTIDDKNVHIFTIDDFLKKFYQVFKRMGYQGDSRNIGIAGKVRLRGLLRNIGSFYHTLPIHELLSKPTIIELDAIKNKKQKNLIISLLLLSIDAYIEEYNKIYPNDSNIKLRNLLLLEEAHVLFETGSESSDLTSKNLLRDMLAERRASGLGIIIADQSPSRLSKEVVAFTNIKLTFNLVEKEDRNILVESTAMEEISINRFNTLKPGEAFFYMNSINRPEEIITKNFREEMNLGITLGDNELKGKIKYWEERKDLIKPYKLCINCSSCKDGCNYYYKLKAETYAKRFIKYFLKNNKRDKLNTKEMFIQLKRCLNSSENTEQFNKCVFLHIKKLINYFENYDF